MGERVQPGAEVSAQVYEQFKEFVRNRDGSLRGNLGAALENAMRNHMKAAQGGGPVERVEQDIATVNRNVAENRELLRELAAEVEGVEADGGARTLSQGDGTLTHREQGTDDSTGTSPRSRPENDRSNEQADDHTGTAGTGEAQIPDEPPHAKASRASKAEWVAAQFEGIGSDASLPRAAIEKKVESVYSFGDDATEALVEATADRLGLEPHPINGDEVFVGSRQADRVLTEAEAEQADETSDEFDDLDDAEPAYE